MRNLKRLLVIEDNDDDFEALLDAFTEASSGKVPVRRCVNAASATAELDRMRRTEFGPEDNPSVIILDLRLPDRSGHEILEELKSDSQLRTIPVIVLSSSMSPDDVDNSYREGANSYVRKPIDLEGFRDLAQRLNGFWLDLAELPGLMPRT